jgi:hypothetical protein
MLFLPEVMKTIPVKYVSFAWHVTALRTRGTCMEIDFILAEDFEQDFHFMIEPQFHQLKLKERC